MKCLCPSLGSSLRMCVCVCVLACEFVIHRVRLQLKGLSMVSVITKAWTVTIDQPQHTLYGARGGGRSGLMDKKWQKMTEVHRRKKMKKKRLWWWKQKKSTESRKIFSYSIWSTYIYSAYKGYMKTRPRRVKKKKTFCTLDCAYSHMKVECCISSRSVISDVTVSRGFSGMMWSSCIFWFLYVNGLTSGSWFGLYHRIIDWRAFQNWNWNWNYCNTKTRGRSTKERNS